MNILLSQLLTVIKLLILIKYAKCEGGKGDNKEYYCPLASSQSPSTEAVTKLNFDCICEYFDNKLFIECDDKKIMDLDTIINELYNTEIELLSIKNANFERLESIEVNDGRSKQIKIKKLEIISSNLCCIKTIKITSHSIIELNLSNNSLIQIPNFDQMPNLSSLRLDHNKIDTIDENSLKELKNLKYLYLKGNFIHSIAKNALENNKKTLKIIDISDNNLFDIPSQNLRNSIELELLDLSNNHINSIKNFQFMNLPSLKELRLNNNAIRLSTKMSFINVANLRNLYLNNNQLESINFSLFNNFHRLVSIDLSNNLLKEIPTFKELPNIKQILLDNNHLTTVNTMTFSKNYQLNTISLQNNSIETIASNGFDSLHQMSILLLTNNSITEIGKRMLDGMKNLKILNLKTNHIKELNNNIFDSLKLLNMIDLSNNNIETIDKQTFSALKHLFWLDLSTNNISILPYDTFTNKISNILLNDNPFNCDPHHIDWLINYLIEKNIRIFLPNQPDVKCAKPEIYRNKRVKELMLEKLNKTINDHQNRKINTNNMEIYENIDENKANNLNSLLNRYRSKQLTIDDINFIIRNLSQLSANNNNKIPGIGEFNIEKISPNLLQYILNGGAIPGIPSTTVDDIINNLMKQFLKNNKKNNEIESVFNEIQTTSPSEKQKLPASDMTSESYQIISPELLKLILQNNNKDTENMDNFIIEAIKDNNFNFSLLPGDLQKYLLSNQNLILSTLLNKENVTIEKIIKLLPKIERPIGLTLSTYTPYNINDIHNGLIENNRFTNVELQYYSTLLLGLIGSISVAIIGLLCIYVRRKGSQIPTAETQHAYNDDDMDKDNLMWRISSLRNDQSANRNSTINLQLTNPNSYNINNTNPSKFNENDVGIYQTFNSSQIHHPQAKLYMQHSPSSSLSIFNQDFSYFLDR